MYWTISFWLPCQYFTLTFYFLSERTLLDSDEVIMHTLFLSPNSDICGGRWSLQQSCMAQGATTLPPTLGLPNPFSVSSSPSRNRRYWTVNHGLLQLFSTHGLVSVFNNQCIFRSPNNKTTPRSLTWINVELDMRRGLVDPAKYGHPPQWWRGHARYYSRRWCTL